jgi:putative DNA primase/helicase
MSEIVTLSPEEQTRFVAEAKAAKLEQDIQAATLKKVIDRVSTQRAAAMPRPLLHVPALVGYTLTQLQGHTFPKRRALLSVGDTAIFRAAEIGQVFAMRGVGKTWLAQTLALVGATGVEALGFANPEPCRVLYIDGEMGSEEIKERFDHLTILLSQHEDVATRGRLFDQLHNDNLVVLGADWQEEFLPRLDTPEGQAAIEPFVEAADLIFFDNRSCLFDPEGEKDPTAWQPTQDYLLSLRRRGKGEMVIHHANRQGGARGISKPEDPMNLLIGLTHTDDYSPDQGARFRVDFEKSRRVYGPAVAPFIATLTPAGWTREPIEREEDDGLAAVTTKLREYLRLANTVNERPKSASAAVKAARVNRNKGFEAWAALLKSGEVAEHADGGFYVVEVEGAM